MKYNISRKVRPSRSGGRTGDALVLCSGKSCSAITQTRQYTLISIYIRHLPMMSRQTSYIVYRIVVSTSSQLPYRAHYYMTEGSPASPLELLLAVFDHLSGHAFHTMTFSFSASQQTHCTHHKILAHGMLEPLAILIRGYLLPSQLDNTRTSRYSSRKDVQD